MMIALTPRIPICRTAQYFNPHFRKGSDRAAAIYRMPGKYFNPHFRKGSDYPVRNIPASPDNFNPHFRKGSDLIGLCGRQSGMISIHTSAREVTRGYNDQDKEGRISIHTSAREVTKCWTNLRKYQRLFQSTLPQGK